MARFNLKIDLPSDQAIKLVLAASPHELAMRRHDERHREASKWTKYITKNDEGDLWRVTGPTDPKGDRKAKFTAGRGKQWYVFRISEGIPDPALVYMKYKAKGGSLPAPSGKYSGYTVPTSKANKGPTTKLRKKVIGDPLGALA